MHNATMNRCCPDFSCCEPDLLAAEHERATFVKAYQEHNSHLVDCMIINFKIRLLMKNKQEFILEIDTLH